ncbi:hypothetical protein I307_03470 [Cryptococcus deuterogattii 99/473]|uniref:Unplaced genomic scaffold supercont1.1, whole genome shotgun sequence n=1 Tax=Cryptococcus deuterogattii Ram5 TaxID=1296110 RepID=A0A0D0U5G4_9TREE|nr:hypothetical protein I309_00498 [Cryptococcus deuterogattii LA55]KIR36977.1 hypothetical protein I352_00289 [Cryptococcus deuterogattii MMRL2647]KIR43448.1 hypothetical protein I313_00290 [Cryptococcus deuterogattii Ram5]KIR74781.1 hypothetical protein I310_01055 [Cryptococcus deuterogattii CA1014]KIR92292.1 hypothetical protein I304_03696 [Cryptococcus deuterogattii CBS 10090]KIS01458.1 hypothetical protein L804_01336 [Cryptococcus deuterogattii 2001/935-1]KIY57136.1 hypothetical protein 
MSEAGSASTPQSNATKDRHEPRGRKPNDQLPPSRAREVQRAFRLRRAEHLASLEERILQLETENTQLRALLSLPAADRPKIGSGPTGRGKSLKEGGVPMSERVRARKEARERERRALGLPEADTTDMSESERNGRDSDTLSPRATSGAGPSNTNTTHTSQQQPSVAQLSNPQNLPMPFNLPVSPDTHFADFTNNLDNSLYKSNTASATPNFSGMFSMFTSADSTGDSSANGTGVNKPSPISPPLTNPPAATPSQLDLLTRLKSCCHVSDSHVVNDPGLLVFATRLCQSFGCSFGGTHTEANPRSDAENLTLEDAWRALKATLDPGGDADGENRINTGKMAAELVVRAAHSRGAGGWITCRYREGLSIRRSMVQALVQGLGGKLD